MSFFIVMTCAHSKIIFLSSMVLIAVIVLNGVIIPLSFTVVSASPLKSFWNKVDNMTTPRSESEVVFLAGKIYVMGGQDRHIKKTNIVEVFDLKYKSWDTTAPLPLHLDHFAADTHDGKIYMVGGSSLNGVSIKLFIYDPLVGKWREGNQCQLQELL